MKCLLGRAVFGLEGKAELRSRSPSWERPPWAGVTRRLSRQTPRRGRPRRRRSPDSTLPPGCGAGTPRPAAPPDSRRRRRQHRGQRPPGAGGAGVRGQGHGVVEGNAGATGGRGGRRRAARPRPGADRLRALTAAAGRRGGECRRGQERRQPRAGPGHPTRPNPTQAGGRLGPSAQARRRPIGAGRRGEGGRAGSSGS